MHVHKALGVSSSILTSHSLTSFYPLAVLALTLNSSQNSHHHYAATWLGPLSFLLGF